MGKRFIKCKDIGYESDQWEQSQKWLAANDMDPSRISINGTIRIDDDKGTITYERIWVGADGRRKLRADGDDYERETVTTPLNATPEEFDIVGARA